MPKPWLDEDTGHEQARQRKLDFGPLIIGSALPDHEKIQRVHRRDPHPRIPFVTPAPYVDGLVVFWAICIVSVILYSTYLIWGLK